MGGSAANGGERGQWGAARTGGEKDYGLLLLSTPGIVGVKGSSKHGG